MDEWHHPWYIKPLPPNIIEHIHNQTNEYFKKMNDTVP